MARRTIIWQPVDSNCKHLPAPLVQYSQRFWQSEAFCVACGQRLWIKKHPIRFLRYLLGFKLP
jgi:hypothetical protein